MNRDKSIMYLYFKPFTSEENILKIFKKKPGADDYICTECYAKIDKSEIERLTAKLNFETGEQLEKRFSICYL